MRMTATAAVYNRLHNTSVGVCGASGSGTHNQLARSLERILEEAHFSGELILANRKLKDFPKTGTKYILTDTVIADLSRNRFCELPEEITAFSFLETLLLYHNTIRSISASVKHLTSLTYLDLRSNQLYSLPRELCFLPLQVLLLSNNRLGTLPDELGRMDRLTDLDVSYNQLTSLPARIGELHSLRSFTLRSNQLTYLPRELTCLTLVSLDISNNRISSLPLEIRQMTTLVELTMENNPLTSPPASLCVRGLVHVFKYLDTQATKDEKGLRAGGNYDGYTTLRRAPRYNCNGGHILETARLARHNVDSGYSTSDGIDKRRSHDMPLKTKPETTLRLTTTTNATAPKSLLLNADPMDTSLTSSTSTIVDEAIADTNKSTIEESCVVGNELKFTERFLKNSSGTELVNTAAHSGEYISNSSNDSSPDLQDAVLVDQQLKQSSQCMPCNKVEDKTSKSLLGNVQTYREYKEALKQQRSQEVYRIKEQKYMGNDPHDPSNALMLKNQQLSNEIMELRQSNGNVVRKVQIMPKSIMKTSANISPNGVNGVCATNESHDDCVVIPKKPVQKVIPSRHTELKLKVGSSNQEVLSNEKSCVANRNNGGVGDGDCASYVKPNSPLKSINATVGIATLVESNSSAVITNTVNGVGVGILTNNNTFAIKSPVGNATNNKMAANGKIPRNVTWNHDIAPEKLSFTMRREFDRQREEIELLTQLRSIIETRLKMTLPDDMAAALTDGVILCHLANYVRPRSVASIHVPSPGVSKLTMARCRRNVDNFLEACRKIGVDEELICSCTDIMSSMDDIDDHDDTVTLNSSKDACSLYFNNNNNNNINYTKNIQHSNKLLLDVGHLKRSQSKPMGNIMAVLRTVAALISLDRNPHHRNIKHLQQQHELQIKLQKYERQHKVKNMQQLCLNTVKLQNLYKNPSQAVLVSVVKRSAGMTLQGLDEVDAELNPERREYSVAEEEEEEDDDDYIYEDDDTDNENVKNRLTNNSNSEHEHLTATCTKEQMMKSVELKNSNCRNDGECMDDNDKQRTNNAPNNGDDDIDGVRCDNIKQFYRHTTLKTFQKIKLNLITAHGNNGHVVAGSFGGSNQMMDRVLPAIVETENDTCCGTPGQTDDTFANTLMHYTHFINEKSPNTKENELELKVAHSSNIFKSNSLPLALTPNKYKLLELPSEKDNHSVIGGAAASASASATSSSILKRIEFFEHANIPNGGIIKPKGNIYSIYRVNEMAEDEKLVKQLVKSKKNLICCAADVLEGKGAVQVAITVGELFRLHGITQQNTTKSPTRAAVRPNTLNATLSSNV